jgi:5,10-methylenetetrahydrofolate reductase
MSDNKTSAFVRKLNDPDRFDVLVEFTCPAGKPPRKVLDFLSACEKGSYSREDVRISGLTVTHNPSGVVTASPSDVLGHILLNGGLRDLEYVPHVSAKGMNRTAVQTFLRGLLSYGIDNCFVVTGDNPADGTPVFEIDSLNMLQTIRQMNAEARVRAGSTDPAALLCTGAAVGLAKYEEGACLQQMIKLEKKVLAGGASFVIPNIIFDPRKVEDFFRYLKERGLTVPVVGSVFFLTEPAARRMLDEKLPGVYVGPDLYAKVRAESHDDQVLRAARQVAMWRDLGARGVDLGNVEDFELASRILDLALEMGPEWRNDEMDLSCPPLQDKPYYLFTPGGERTELRDPGLPAKRLFMRWVHNLFFEPGSMGYRAARALFESSRGIKKGEGFLYEATKLIEYAGKNALVRCRVCGDCRLPENFFVCLQGECSKGLTNVPCGDSTVDGRCGVDTARICAGRLVYDAARYFTKESDSLFQQVNAPGDPGLRQTSSFRSFFLGLDHRSRAPIIQVAELLHASLPRVKEAFAIIRSTERGFEMPNPGLDYLFKIIESQAFYMPDYIDANVDDAGEGETVATAALMREAVRLICEHGGGIPPCIDSSDTEVIRAGLDEYYGLCGKGSPPPLINSANRERRDFLWPLQEIGPFSIVYMLNVGALSSEGTNEETTPELLEQKGLEFFREARRHGFKPQQVFFDTAVIPLVIEFSRFDSPGFNHVSIEGIRRIMSNPEMKGVNTILGITNLIRDFPPGRKTGLLRGYMKIAMEAGLSAGIVNVAKKFGVKKAADREIVDIVSAFTGQDGSAEAFDRMQEAYGRYKSFGLKKKKP